MQLEVEAPWSSASDSSFADRFTDSILDSSGEVHSSAWVEVEGTSFVAFLAGAFPLVEVVALPQTLTFSAVTLGLIGLNSSVPRGLL